MLNLNFFILKHILLLQLRNKNMASVQSREIKEAEEDKKEAKKEAKKARKKKIAARNAFKKLREEYRKVYCGDIGIPPSKHNIAEICDACKARVAYLYYLGYTNENSDVKTAEAKYEMIRQCAEALATWMEYRAMQ
jgi:hypothetical protein